MPVLPRLSIVMPSLNQARFIEAAIDSVLGQDVEAVELIVADGGSSDGTQALLAAWAARDARLRWRAEPDDGPAQAVNKALSQVRGTLVGWLNADDLYLPGALARTLAAFDAAPQHLLIYGHGRHVDEAGQPLEPYPTLPPDTPLAHFAQGCFLCQPTVFFRRTLLVLLGKLDEKLRCSFDFDYWLRVFKAFPDRIGFIDALQASTRLHADCITLKQRRQVALEGVQILHRHLGQAPKEWLLTYAIELLAQPPAARGVDDSQLRAHLENTIREAQPYLTTPEYRDLEKALEEVLKDS